MRAIYIGSLPYVTQLLAGFEEGGCQTRGFRKFLTTIRVSRPSKKALFAELDCNFDPPKKFVDYLQEQGLECPLLHIRALRRNDWDEKKVVMWLTGLPRLPYHKMNGDIFRKLDSFRKVVRSLADLVVSTPGGVDVRIPTPDEQREYETHCSLIMKATHPALHFNPLPNLTLSSLRASKEYSPIDAERQLDVCFRLNTPECVREGKSESVIRIAERVGRGPGYDLALVLVKGCPDTDVFYRSYEGSALWQKLSETVPTKGAVPEDSQVLL